MNVTRNNISANRVELTVEISAEEAAKFAERAAVKISEGVSIEGFRPGKAPYDRVKTKVGEMAILEEASRLAVSKTIDRALTENITEEWIGQPEISVTKLAPGNAIEYRILVSLLPSVTLGAYKGLGIEPAEVEVKEEEVDKMIEQLRDFRVKEAAVDRPCADGDKLVADVNLFLDKVPVEGGQARETTIIVGKDYFVPGFDEQVKGMKAGDKREFFVTYPADHHQKHLAGKKVEFSVVAKQVYSRELPELDEEFVSAFGLKNAEELRINIRRSIEEEKKGEEASKHERRLLERIAADSTIGELPENLIESETHSMIHELEHNVTRSGGSFADYLASINKLPEQLKADFREQAIERLKVTLVIRAIVAAEKIEVIDEEVKNELATLKSRYHADPKAMEALNDPSYPRQLRSILLNRRVIEKLRHWNSTKTAAEVAEPATAAEPSAPGEAV